MLLNIRCGFLNIKKMNNSKKKESISRADVPDRIILTGFRATGKSTVGRQLAGQLNYRFIDTDKLLSERFNCTIAQYVMENDWQAFRAQEGKLLFELSEITNVVISTGGGAVINDQQWVNLRKGSLVIWLQADAVTIQERLSADAETTGQRPSLTGESIAEEVEKILTEREPLYRRSSDMAMDTVATGPEELVQNILQLLGKNNKQDNRQDKNARK